MDWNTPLINGFTDQPFISKESFQLYSIDADYELMDLNDLSDSDADRPIVESIEQISKAIFMKSTKLKNQKKLSPPFFSSLTKEQHMKYLDLCAKYRVHVPSNHEEQRELHMLKDLHVIVANEQNEFIKYLRNIAELNSENYLFIKEDYEVYINKFLENQRKRVLLYPKFYVLHNAIPLAGNGIHFNKFFRKNVLIEMGHIPKVTAHNTRKGKFRLPHDVNKINAKFPCEIHHEEFGQDVNVEMLASEFDVDVAMSYTSLECLFDNHAPNFTRQWELPLTVKRDCSGKKLVIVGDPFVARNMTTPEKNQLFHEFSVKAHFINHSHANYYDLDIMSEHKNKSQENIWEETDDGEDDKRSLKDDYGTEEIFIGNDDKLTELEGGIISDVMTQHKNFLDVSSDDEELVIDESSFSPIRSYDGQNDKEEHRKCHQNFAESSMLGSDIKDAPFIVQQSLNNSYRKLDRQPNTDVKHLKCSADDRLLNYVPVKSSEGYKRPNKGNLSYFSLVVGRHNVLVRSSYDGFMKVKKLGNIIELFTKLEYQHAHGFEKLSISELSRVWLALQIKPALKYVLLARVDPFTTELIHHEKINKEVLNYDFQKCLQQLEVIIKTLVELDCGSYLISHTPGNAHFQIKKNTISQNGAYNLHLAHDQTGARIGAQETFERTWLPIDVDVHSNFRPTFKIPCTFELRDNQTINTKSKKRK